MLGCSENAVKTHLWIAICTYLILTKVKASYDSPYSITEIGTLIKVYALVKTDLKTLVTTPQPLIQNQDFKELTLFDNSKRISTITKSIIVHHFPDNSSRASTKPFTFSSFSLLST